MTHRIKVTREVEVKYLRCLCGVRYWEDAKVNGADDKDGDLIPCRVGDAWIPVIDIDEGRIINWEKGKTADIHYKVCDEGVYELQDEAQKTVHTIEGYVPDIMSPGGRGYGDYIIMSVDEDGNIKDWEVKLDEFSNED